MLSIWMLILLYQFVKSTLLQSLDIISCMLLYRKFVLIEVKLVAAAQNYQFIIMIKLCLPYLLRKWILLAAFAFILSKLRFNLIIKYK